MPTMDLLHPCKDRDQRVVTMAVPRQVNNRLGLPLEGFLPKEVFPKGVCQDPCQVACRVTTQPR